MRALCGLLAAIACAALSAHVAPQAPTMPAADQLATTVLEVSSPEARSALLAGVTGAALRGVAVAVIDIAERHRIAGALDRALEASRVAADLADQLDDPSVRTRSWNTLGGVLIERGQYDEALGVLDRSRALSLRTDDTPSLIDALLAISTAHFRKGDRSESLAAAEESLALSRQLGSSDGIVRGLSLIGIAARQRGEFDRAVLLYEEAIALGERAGADLPLARVLNNLGVAERERGNSDRAIAAFRRAIEVYERIGYRAAAAGSRANLGYAYHDQGLNDLALEHLLHALEVLQEAGDRQNVAFTLGTIGFVYRGQGNDTLALEYYRRALAEHEAIGSRDGIAVVSAYLARIHVSRGDYAAAEPLFARALEFRRAIGDRAGIANVVLDYGSLYEHQGQLALALQHFQDGLALLREIHDRRSLSHAYLRLAGIHNKRGEYRSALDAAMQAADAAVSAGQQARYWATQLAAGRAWRGRGDADRAREAFEKAIDSIEQLRSQMAGGEEEQQRAFELKIDPYHEMVALLADAGDVRGALEYAERAKGRVLVDVLRHGRVNITKAMTEEEKLDERRLNDAVVAAAAAVQRERQQPSPDADRIADAERRLGEAQSRADTFRNTLYARHPELRARRSEIPPVGRLELHSLIPDTRTALIEYVVTRAGTFVFVVTKGTDVEITLHRVDRASDELERDIATFRDGLGRRDLGFRRQATALYALLLDPVRARLVGRSRLVIVPDGPLWELPFQALAMSDGRFLIERYTVTAAPSLTALHVRRLAALPAMSRPQSVVAFADPRSDGASGPGREGANEASPLPGSTEEAHALRRLYGSNTRIFVGRDASERRFKSEARGASILHVASHGVLSNEDPMGSHLLLAPSQEDGAEDGRLQAREILTLDLDAELAILSGCETARGRVGAGEGVIGLTWALFVAGVPTTVVSQWKVDSESTARLMIGLHQRLAAAGSPRMTPADALRASALTMIAMERYRHPFYWAGFVVVGDGLRPWQQTGSAAISRGHSRSAVSVVEP